MTLTLVSENSFPCSECNGTTTNKEEYKTRLNYYKKLDN